MEQNSLNTQITKENKNADFSEMLEYESSNYETLNASIKGQSQYSKNSINSNTILFPLFSPNLYNKLDFKKDQLKFFSKQNILFSFTNQKSTKQLQKV